VEEKAARLKKVQLFVFDRDHLDTGLKSTELVRVRQLGRYCLENYLLDEEILYDKVSKYAKKPLESRGKFPSILKELALNQTSALAIKDIYLKRAPESTGIRKSDFEGRTVEDAAEILAGRLEIAKPVFDEFDRPSWVDAFVTDVNARKSQIDDEWSIKWEETCSGKKLIQDLYRRYEISIKQVEFKKEIIKVMAERKADDWRIINDLLVSGLR
jgi:hypothetical protein